MPSNSRPLPLAETCPASPSRPRIPNYLQQVYWWAYLHPRAVRFFEREWLVNLILWGNFARLRDALIAEIEPESDHSVLQIACVYGDFTAKLAASLNEAATLTVIDVARIQLANLRRKLAGDSRLRLLQQDSAQLQLASGSVDTSILFFLLHEQPEEVRRATLREALRVTRPGGKVIIVDYHRPARLNPLRYLMRPVLRALEPFALDLWRDEIAAYLPAGVTPDAISKTCYFGRLYQKVVIRT